MNKLFLTSLIGLTSLTLATDVKYNYRLKAGAAAGSMSATTQVDANNKTYYSLDISGDAIELSNSNESSETTPWEFELYALDNNAAHWPTGAQPSNIGSWNTTELGLIEKASNFWNNSGARVKINFHKSTPTDWKTNYGWATPAGYPYTITKVTGSLTTQDGYTEIFASNATGIAGQNWNFVGRAGGAVPFDFSEPSVSAGGTVWGLYLGCDPSVSGYSVCAKRIPGCTGNDPVYSDMPSNSCLVAPANVSVQVSDGACLNNHTLVDAGIFSCFVKKCNDILIPNTGVIDYNRCLVPSNQIVNLHASTIVLNYQTAHTTTFPWSYDPTNIDEAGQVYKPSTKTYDYSKIDNSSFTQVLIHELGHYLGFVEHDNKTYNVDEKKVGNEFTTNYGVSYKDWLLRSFSLQPVIAGSYYYWSNSKFYANQNIAALPVQYVDASNNVFDLTLVNERFVWKANTSTPATSILPNAWARDESFMNTAEVGTNPNDLKTSSYLGFGRACFLETTGCSGVTNPQDQLVDYKRLYDLYNAEPETKSNRGVAQ